MLLSQAGDGVFVGARSFPPPFHPVPGLFYRATHSELHTDSQRWVLSSTAALLLLGRDADALAFYREVAMDAAHADATLDEWRVQLRAAESLGHKPCIFCIENHG